MWNSLSLFLYFRLFITGDSIKILYVKVCWWLDWNRGPLVSEATALPTEPQLLTKFYIVLHSFLCTFVPVAPGSNPTHTLVHLICSFHSLIDSIIACSWIVNYRKLNTKERVRSKFKTEKKTIFYFITIFLRSFFIFVRWGKFWNWRSSIFCWLWWCIRVRHVVKAILKSASSELTKLWKPKAIPPSFLLSCALLS